ncbi:sulfotransferase 1 family member D1-like [Argiope bruennichi]|uniref:sulfotransferase 1 family member D1-like n=1 Tax=Argiope bruennichi TaxID=94029 RepID=UPI00249451A3|nr:sulfotransferase 1 family member D1-like [Argiope bruennichi]
MSESPATLPIYEIEGLKMPLMFSPDAFRSGIQYKPRPNDVFIVTYPKCGTTWAQHILLHLFSRGEAVDENKFFSATPFLEVTGAKAAETMPRPGALKTHLPFHLTPWSDEAKYIYITRNPKDCCVSYYHHMKNLPGHGFKGTFDEFFECFISGNIGYGDYFDNLLGWYEHRNDPNVLFMTYEEMKENPEAAILKMASFIDEEEYAKLLREDPEKLQRVLKYSSFKHMKEVVNESMNNLFNMSKEELFKSDLPDEMKKSFDSMREEAKLKGDKPEASNFVRKGIVGDWRNHFSEEQSKRMDQKFAERTKGTELKNLWKNYM